MTVEALKSTAITNADASPVVVNQRGAGAPAYRYMVDDTVTPTASGLGSAGSTYRMCRIPVEAHVKAVRLAIAAALDSNASPTLIFDLNLAFSDATTDGTQATLQGLIPTSANTGATTTVAAYSSPNKIFGSTTATQDKTTLVLAPIDFVFNGVGSNYAMSFVQNPLWSVFGFTNPYGMAADPSGYFDLLLYVATGAATAASAAVYGSIDYVV